MRTHSVVAISGLAGAALLACTVTTTTNNIGPGSGDGGVDEPVHFGVEPSEVSRDADARGRRFGLSNDGGVRDRRARRARRGRGPDRHVGVG